MPYPMKKKNLKIIEYSCIKCKHKFNKMSYDLNEKMCYECLYTEIDYEPTTADEYNADYIEERLNNSKNKKDKQNGS